MNEAHEAIRIAVAQGRDCTDPYTGEPGHWIPDTAFSRLRVQASNPMPGSNMAVVTVAAICGALVGVVVGVVL